MSVRAMFGAACLAVLTTTALAGQVTIPIRALGPVAATSPAIFKTITNVRQLSDGRILVNDASGRQIVLLDAALARPTVLIDSAAGKDNSYGAGSGGLIPYLADSTLFVDRAAQAFVVLDPAGKIARVTPLPGRSSYLYLTDTSPLYGLPGVSPALGLVYAIPDNTIPRRPAAGSPDMTLLLRDTSILLTYDFASHKTDTLARFSNGRGTVTHLTTTGITSEVPNLLSSRLRIADDWTLVTDGSVAIVHSRDYRIDWINTDGTPSSSPRIAHDWVRYSDDDKMRLVDSVNRTTRQFDSMSVSRWILDSIATANGKGDSVRAARLKGLSSGPPSMAQVLDDALARSLVKLPRPKPSTLLQVTDVPDYQPALEPLSGSVRGDGDNNIWVRAQQLTRTPNTLVYDVVNRQGILVDRVSIPSSLAIVGFAPGGIVYLMGRDAGAAMLERAKWK